MEMNRDHLQDRKAVSKPVLIGVLVIVIILALTVFMVVLRHLLWPSPDFEISADPTLISIPRGGSGNTTITIKSLNGFNSTVEFTVTVSYQITYISTQCPPVTPPPDGQVTTTLTIRAREGTYIPSGTHDITLHAKSRDPDIHHLILLHFTVT